MRPFRASLTEVRDTKTAEAKASVIWGVLQQHRIMDEFIALKFEAHPAIVRELSLFIITERVDPQAIIPQGERLGAAEATVEKLEKSVSSLLDATAANKRHHDNLTNDLRQFKATKK
jgi:predicted RNase H-like nuclease (RuvC/YqgF family)